MFRHKLFIFQLCILLTLFVAEAKINYGQTDTASVTGQITDAQGAVVEGARVLVTNQATYDKKEARMFWI